MVQSSTGGAPVRYLDLFSGIAACSVAWRPLGWECVGYAEIEPFPCHVLAHHYGASRPEYMPDPDAPDITDDERKKRRAAIRAVQALPVVGRVPNLGDVSQVPPERLAKLGPFDLVVGGSPCQDLSVAGKRAGLEGERSGLFHQQVRIFHAARAIHGTRFLMWENVPGAFSSNGGSDFAVVVGKMVGGEFDVPRDGWRNSGVAIGPDGLLEWCTLDAQYFGLAQRRERVFAVLDTGKWWSRSPILLEPESLRGDSPPRRAPRERVAGTITGGAETDRNHGKRSGSDRHVVEVVGPMAANGDTARKHGYGMGQQDYESGYAVAVPLLEVGKRQGTRDSVRDGLGIGREGDAMFTLQADARHGIAFGGNNTAGEIEVSTAVRGHAGHHYDFESETFVAEVAPTLTGAANETGGDRPPGMQVETAESLVVAFDCKRNASDSARIDLSPTLRALDHDESHANGGGQVAVAFGIIDDETVTEEHIGTLQQPSATGGGHPPAVAFKASHYTRDKDGAPSEIAPPLSADADKGDQDTLVLADAIPITADALRGEGAALTPNPDADGNVRLRDPGLGVGAPGDPASTLAAAGPGAVAFEARFARNGRGAPSDVVPPLCAQAGETGKGDAAPLVMAFTQNQREEVRISDTMGALNSAPDVKRSSGTVMAGMQVRRLTPRECERLQGYEDDYTLIQFNGKPAADGPRYRALGNSMATRVMRWLGKRLQAAIDHGRDSA